MPFETINFDDMSFETINFDDMTYWIVWNRTV